MGTTWGGIFYHPIFVDAGAEFLNLAGHSFNIILDERNSGALNILARERPLIRRATIPHLFQYCGPLIYGKDFDLALIAKSIDHYFSLNYDFAYLSIPPQTPLDKSHFNGWKIIQTYTVSIGGADLKNWGRDFKERVVRKIKKAQKEKIEVRIVDNLPLGLWQMPFERKGKRPIIPPSSVESWARKLIDASLLKVYAAFFENEPIAFRAELIYGNFAYDWVAGSNPEFHNLGSNQLLMAEIGYDIMRNGIETWDMVAGQIESIAEFKKSFGGKETPHLHIKKSFNLAGRLFDILREIKHARH